MAGRQIRLGLDKSAPKAARVDAVAAVIMACQAVARLIGKPETSDRDGAAAWVDVDRSSVRPVVRIHSRGVTIQGDRVSRALVNGRVVAVDHTLGGHRSFSLSALRSAAVAARDALSAAGVALSTFSEVRATRQGGVAVIGLRRSPTPELSPSF